MKFCPECGNLLNFEDENGELMSICIKCGFKEKSNISVVNSHTHKKMELIDNKAKKYYIYDQTYPRTIHNKCPNIECPTQKKPSLQEAIFFEDKSMKITYICTTCKTEWKFS